MSEDERASQPRVTVGSRVPCLECQGSGVSFWVEQSTYVRRPVVCRACDGKRTQVVIEPPPEAP